MLQICNNYITLLSIIMFSDYNIIGFKLAPVKMGVVWAHTHWVRGIALQVNRGNDVSNRVSLSVSCQYKTKPTPPPSKKTKKTGLATFQLDTVIRHSSISDSCVATAAWRCMMTHLHYRQCVCIGSTLLIQPHTHIYTPTHTKSWPWARQRVSPKHVD